MKEGEEGLERICESGDTYIQNTREEKLTRKKGSTSKKVEPMMRTVESPVKLR